MHLVDTTFALVHSHRQDQEPSASVKKYSTANKQTSKQQNLAADLGSLSLVQ